jgi:hypothetical protein
MRVEYEKRCHRWFMVRIKVQKIGNMHSVAVTPHTTVAECVSSLLLQLVPSTNTKSSATTPTLSRNATQGPASAPAPPAPALAAIDSTQLEQIQQEYASHWLFLADDSGERLLYPYEPAVCLSIISNSALVSRLTILNL